MSKLSWKLNGQMVLACNCDVFCPCVVSLGKARPTYGYCQTWAAMKIDNGIAGNQSLDGLSFALIFDVPGKMSEGNWKAAIYIDDRATPVQVELLTSILKGEHGGPPTVLRILVGEFIGVKQVPISMHQEGRGWKVVIPKILDGQLAPVPGVDDKKDVVIANSKYWISPDVHVLQSKQNRFRDFGRNWELTGQSAEYVKVNWSA